MPTIPYHLDDDGGAVLSLQWVHPDLERVASVERDRRTSNTSALIEHRSRVVEEDSLDNRVYCLYEAELHPRQYPDLESDQFESISTRERIFLDTVLDAFSSIEEEWEDTGKDTRWYKEPELEKVLEALDRVQFRQPVALVGGELLSRFISEHPLPNGNHRVGLSLLETYLTTYEPSFELPKTGVTGEWFDWAEEFVFESKRLMTVARKCGLLRNLRDHGCTGVVRDQNNVIQFDEFDFDVDDYFDIYGNNVHLESCEAFVHGVLDRTENHHLIGMEDDGRRAFIDRLSA